MIESTIARFKAQNDAALATHSHASPALGGNDRHAPSQNKFLQFIRSHMSRVAEWTEPKPVGHEPVYPQLPPSRPSTAGLMKDSLIDMELQWRDTSKDVAQDMSNAIDKLSALPRNPKVPPELLSTYGGLRRMFDESRVAAGQPPLAR